MVGEIEAVGAVFTSPFFFFATDKACSFPLGEMEKKDEGRDGSFLFFSLPDDGDVPSRMCRGEKKWDAALSSVSAGTAMVLVTPSAAILLFFSLLCLRRVDKRRAKVDAAPLVPLLLLFIFPF